MEFKEIDLKDLIFLIYSAGFEAGYGGKKDLGTAFNEYYSNLERVKNPGELD